MDDKVSSRADDKLFKVMKGTPLTKEMLVRMEVTRPLVISKVVTTTLTGTRMRVEKNQAILVVTMELKNGKKETTTMKIGRMARAPRM